MAKILFLEWCDYMCYPTGGHLSFARHMLGAFGNELKLVGIDTANECKVGAWMKRSIDGIEYDYFCVGSVKKSSKKPLIPSRITAYLQMRKYMRKILRTSYDYILIQTPEVLLSLPKKVLNKVCLIMPGVENPLTISRYKILQRFAGFYDGFFFKKASHVNAILPAADEKSIEAFIARGRGAIPQTKVRQFPTRYDANIFKVKDGDELRKKYGIMDNCILFVTVGRLNWFKGWKFMIDSLSRLNNPLAKLVFIGDGEDEYKIRDYVKEKKLDIQVDLIGRQSLDVIADYLNMANAFIMGSYKECWSTSLVEAVACACPCVVTDFSSASDMIEEGVNGWVIKNRNEDEFTRRMSDVLSLEKDKILEKAKNISSLSVQNMREQMILKADWKD